MIKPALFLKFVIAGAIALALLMMRWELAEQPASPEVPLAYSPSLQPREPATVEPAGLTVAAPRPAGEAPAGMVWIPGGIFLMGSSSTTDSEAMPREGPPHKIFVDSFWMDVTEVTNRQFAEFVAATNYVTYAERKPDWEEIRKQAGPGAKKPPDDVLVPGSLVFVPTEGPVNTQDWSQWWRWTHGASWRHPEGPASDIAGKDDLPAVHIAWFDAVAYCEWAHKRLPTEAEWEFAARGGDYQSRYIWGNDPPGKDVCRANTFQGNFPYKNLATDQFVTAAPVKSFSANGYGLYDMAGNLWEHTSDWYRENTYAKRIEAAQADPAVLCNPQGPETSFDPEEPFAKKHVIRGGSFLCNPSYCSGYRATARMMTSPDSGTNHTGFRCVKSPEKVSPEKTSANSN